MWKGYTIPPFTGNEFYIVWLFVVLYLLIFSDMAKQNKGRKRKRSPSASSSESSGSSSPPASESEDQVKNESSSEEEVIDAKDQFIAEAFKSKPVKMVVSPWILSKLRVQFLGIPIGKDERSAISADYYCAPEDFRKIAPPRLSGM